MDYERFIAERAKSIEISTIRYFFNAVKEVDGAVSLCIGEPDLFTPIQTCQTAVRSIKESKTYYTVNAGVLELRKEISNYLLRRFKLKYAPSEIIATVGASQAIDVAMRTLVEPGDEVLIPNPSFVSYGPCAILSGGKPVYVPTYEIDDFVLKPELLKKYITEKSKILVLPYPNNPTGAVISKGQMEEIAKVVKEKDLIVITDEVYCELTYGAPHIPFATLPGMWERTVTINGLSKSYAMTGWRLGYICAPEVLRNQMLKIHQYNVTCATSITQYAGINALKTGDEDIEYMRDLYDERRKYLLSSLEEMGLECFEPKGAFYVFPSIKNTGLTSEKFAERLLYEAKVAVVPGNAFGKDGEGYVRLAYATSMENLKLAVERMHKFLKNI